MPQTEVFSKTHRTGLKQWLPILHVRFKDGYNSKSLEAESNNLNSYYKQANK